MSKTVSTILAHAVRMVTALQTPNRRSNTQLRLANLLTQRTDIQTAAGPLTFVSSHPQALADAIDILVREPDTIAWIDAMPAGAALWDIGANIGLYALYAARRGIKVHAFEPAPASFAAMAENIRANSLDDQITALPVAIGGSDGLGRLTMHATNAASVMNSIDAAADGCFRQAVIVHTIDRLIDEYRLPVPAYIKLDVDGVEAEIIEGARRTLADPALRSILVEIEDANPNNGRIDTVAFGAGLTVVSHGPSHTVGTHNVIFSRPIV